MSSDIRVDSKVAEGCGTCKRVLVTNGAGVGRTSCAMCDTVMGRKVASKLLSDRSLLVSEWIVRLRNLQKGPCD